MTTEKKATADCHHLTTSDSPWWAKLLDRFGVPTAMLAVMIYFAYSSASWIAEHIAQPIARGHLEFLQSVDVALQKQTLALEELASTNATAIQIQSETLKQVRVLLLEKRDGNEEQ